MKRILAIFALLLAALLLPAGPALAQEVKQQAVNAAYADGASTALGLAVGAAEMNPLGPILTLAMKPLVLNYVATLPDVEQPAAYAMAASIWGGAAANNLCVAASVLTGGGFAPVCLVLGVAWGMKTWNESEHERQFWVGCAMLRDYAQLPNLPCIYTPPDHQLAVVERSNFAATHPAPMEAP